MSEPITIVYADTCEAYRLGLGAILKEYENEIKLLTTTSNAASTKKAVVELKPTLLIFELDIPGMEGLEICNWLFTSQTATRSLALSMYKNNAMINEVVEAGIHGYIKKGCTASELVAYIKTISKGGTAYCSECSEAIARRNRNVQQKPFTPMEKKVINLLCQGMETPELAKTLNRSKGAINGYRASISEKIGSSNHFRQAIYAVHYGLVDPSSWIHFRDVVSVKNYKEFKNISLSELHTCDTTLLMQKFIDKCFLEVFDKTLLQKFADTLYSDYVDSEMELGYFSQSALKQIDTKDTIIILRQFQIVKELTPDGAWTMTFDFVKTKDGYKFFGCDSFGGPICCR